MSVTTVSASDATENQNDTERMVFAFTDEPQTPGSLTGVDAISASQLLLAPVAKGWGASPLATSLRLITFG